MSASDKNSITFHSPELADAFDRYGEVLTGYNSARDKVSEDIKLLEKKLQQANLNNQIELYKSLGGGLKASSSETIQVQPSSAERKADKAQ